MSLMKVIDKKLLGFTLSEVLITLGIIGIVASLTMPTLIENHRKKVTEVRLERFYSLMSQAVIAYEEKNNMLPEDWDHSWMKNATDLQKWWNETLGTEIRTANAKIVQNRLFITFPDGSGVVPFMNGKALHFSFCVEARHCGFQPNNTQIRTDGKTSFLFTMKNGEFITSMSQFDNYTREQLVESCKYGNWDNNAISTPDKRHACTRLIQVDGWKIKDDYPWNQIILEPAN